MDSKSGEPFDIEDEELFIEHTSKSVEDEEFDSIIGLIEEFMFSAEFEELQNGFCQNYSSVFEETKENKLEYTELFQNYTKLIENNLEDMLKSKLPGFNMDKLERLLVDRKDELSGEVFELLTSLGDFQEFKEFMIAHKKSTQTGFGNGLEVCGHHF